MEPSGSARLRFPHVAALDGLRGAAVLAVLLYHGAFLDQAWLRGGYLGVDLFFVLSGYLITSLLLVEFANDARIDLLAFWGRRIRRLLPALLLVLVGVALYAVLVARPIDLQQIREDGLGSLFYVANWVSIFRGGSYFDISLAPSPLQHTWSLAIEEQFYLVWPLVVWALASGIRGSQQRGIALARRVQVVAVCGVVLSAWLFTGLWRLGASETRVYQGTDTRAFALLMGVTLAATRFLRPPKPPVAAASPARGRFSGLEVAGIVAMVLLGWAWVELEGTSPALYQGLLPVCSLLGAIVIAAASAPSSPVVARILAVAPLRWFGLISYGLYLWHWPVYLVLTPDRTGLHGASLLFVRIACSVAIAALSFVLLEQPIRTRQWTFARPALSAGLAMGAVVVLVLIASAGATDQRGGLDASGPRTSKTTVAGAPKVDYLGDSVGYSLAEQAVQDPAAYGINPANRAALGCSFLPAGRRVRYDDGGVTTPEDCLPAMTKAVVADDPDAVVVVFGSPFTQQSVEIDGAFRDPCSPEYADLLRTTYEDLAEEITADGAVMFLGTLVPRGALAPAHEKERVACANDVIRSVGDEVDGVEVLDLEAFVCPGGTCRKEVDGKPLRPDGLHFAGEGGATVAVWAADQVKAGLSGG